MYLTGCLGLILAIMAFGCSQERDVPLNPAPVTPPRQQMPIGYWPEVEPPLPLPSPETQSEFRVSQVPYVDVDRRFYNGGGGLFRQPLNLSQAQTADVVPFARMKTISKGFDGNRNNWLDGYEVALSQQVRQEASGGDGKPHNGIVGTSEMARALYGGRVLVRITEPRHSQRVADVLIQAEQAREFQPGAWIVMHADLDGDGRLNAIEYTQALAGGQLQVGRTLYWETR